MSLLMKFSATKIPKKKEAMKFIAMNTKGKEIINVIDILTNNFAWSFSSLSLICSGNNFSNMF